MQINAHKTYDITNLGENEFLAIRIGVRGLSVKKDEALAGVATNMIKELDKISV